MNLRTSGAGTDIRTYDRADLFADEGSESFLRDYFRDTGHLDEYESGEFFMTEEMEEAVESLSPTERKGWNSLPDAVKRRIMMQSLRKVASKYENDIFLNTDGPAEREHLSEADEAKYGQGAQSAFLAQERLRELEEEVEAEIAEEELEEAEKERRQKYLRYKYEKIRRSEEFKNCARKAFQKKKEKERKRFYKDNTMSFLKAKS